MSFAWKFWLIFTACLFLWLLVSMYWVSTINDYRRILWKHYGHQPAWHWWRREPPG